MGRGAVGQAGPDRPQSSHRRPPEHGAKGQPPRSPDAGRILGIQRDSSRVQSVSGGGHWGGGVFISAGDQARIGLMLLHRGVWGSCRILSKAWIELMLEPCAGEYGFVGRRP